MAKKNSTKTATKEALRASEPKLQTFKSWQGINIKNAPLNWNYENDDNSQTDLQTNYLLVQNNVETTVNLALETRPKELDVASCPLKDGELTGVAYLKGKWLYAVATKDDMYYLYRKDITTDELDDWKSIKFITSIRNEDNSITVTDTGETGEGLPYEITHIYSYLDNYVEQLIVMVNKDNRGAVYTGPTETIEDDGVSNSVSVSTPVETPKLVCHKVMPYSNRYDFWRNLILYATHEAEGLIYSKHYDPSAGEWVDDGETTLIIGSKYADSYGGFISDDFDPEIIESISTDAAWYITESTYADKDNSMIWRPAGKNVPLYKLTFAENYSSSGSAPYFYAHFYRLLMVDKTEFDKAFCYRYYVHPDTDKIPSTVEIANEWYNDSTNINLTNATLITKWSNSPEYVSTLSSKVIPDPDADYETVLEYLPIEDETASACRWGIDYNGRCWVWVQQKRSSTGADRWLFYINTPDKGDMEAESSGVSNVNLLYSYSNRFGQTTLGTDSAVLQFSPSYAVSYWTASRYVSFHFTDIPKDQDIESIVLYVTMNESESPIYIGSIDVTDDSKDVYSFDWYGASADTDEWSDANMEPDEENTTEGPDARYCRMHDGRLYFWGSPTKPYRLIIGGNSGEELNISRGHGGAFIDIEPGIGTIVTGTYKWKTTSGAAIVTILCGNENTSQHKRFNLVESNITVDTELAEQSYMVEEIPNTVGCQSTWGAGVWADGFYVLSRYGLTLTTMAMEYNSQVSSQVISDPVEPAFTDKIATLLDDARMVHVNGTIYICFSTEDDPQQLDRVMLCYDMGTKAWYTHTFGTETDDVRHIMNIDYKGSIEGVGIIYTDRISMLQTTGTYDPINENKVDYLIETGELSTTLPTQATSYVAQCEFRFDWFIGDMDIVITGVDHYGRHVEIKKHIHTDEAVNDYVAWMRVNYYFENYHIVFSGNAMFRMSHFISKVYVTSNKIGITRGYDSLATYKNRHGGTNTTRHYIRNYANLRETLLT